MLNEEEKAWLKEATLTLPELSRDRGFRKTENAYEKAAGGIPEQELPGQSEKYHL